MFDIGWSELLVIGAVAVVAIGPKELPEVMRGLGRVVRRAQYVKYAFSRQFEDFMREHDLEQLRNLPRETGAAFDEATADEHYMTGVNFEAKSSSHRHPGERRDPGDREPSAPVTLDPGVRRDDGDTSKNRDTP